VRAELHLGRDASEITSTACGSSDWREHLALTEDGAAATRLAVIGLAWNVTVRCSVIAPCSVTLFTKRVSSITNICQVATHVGAPTAMTNHDGIRHPIWA